MSVHDKRPRDTRAMDQIHKLSAKGENTPKETKNDSVEYVRSSSRGDTPERIYGTYAQEAQLSSTSDGTSLALSEDQKKEIGAYIGNANNALRLVDDIVMKSYLTKLSDLDVVRLPDDKDKDDIMIFKVERMVYQKDENATDKFVSALGAMSYADCAIALIVDGKESGVDFYIAVRNNDNLRTTKSLADTFECSLKGQFPGIEITDCSVKEKGKLVSSQDELLNKLTHASSISSFSGVPAYKSAEGNYNNESYVQGIEKLVLALRGKKYTAVILASNFTPGTMTKLRSGYETLYSQLSTIATQQISYSTNESLANALSRSKGHSSGKTISKTVQKGTNESKSKSHTVGSNWNESQGTGQSKPNFWSKGSQMATSVSTAGAILTGTGVGAPLGIAMMGVGAVLGLGGIIDGKTKSTNQNTSTGGSESDTDNTSIGTSRSESEGTSIAETDTITDTEGNTSTVGSSKNFTLTSHNKQIEELLKRIDTQLERISMSESTGLWSAGAYFISYDNDRATAETAAAIFKSLMQGEKSGVELSALNVWYPSNDDRDMRFPVLTESIKFLTHPTFLYSREGVMQDINVTSTSLLSSKELAMMLGLPRRSVPGLPVLEHLPLGQEVVRHSGRKADANAIDMGCIFNQGAIHTEIPVKLNLKSLTQHVFVTGSTGCGKSETVYRLISEAKKKGVNFMIVEPAKGEYKTVFGNANIFGTNPLLTKILRINPFRFPKGIHVLEHIDRLTEIFNVCWPMYAAMPAVLKKSMLKAYESCGWNLIKSVNNNGDEIFPSFIDLLKELESTISESAYSEEVKGNYVGSLVTRVESLTNGLNGEIFTANELSDHVLFDEDTIIDLSRVGSQETKSLIMGILIMRLSEYRMSTAEEANSKLRHITVLEEAHNILKRSTTASAEGADVAGKSVEMITNAIAEMRTYGEGFIIVDQSPTSVDPAAIKNTNTKFIMRLPDGDDRRIAGKAAGMKDTMVDEISKLPTGVAVTYQNDWVEPVLTQVTMMNDERVKYQYTAEETDKDDISLLPMAEMMKFLLNGRLSAPLDINIAAIKLGVERTKLPTKIHIQLKSLINEYEETGEIKIWGDSQFAQLAELVTSILNIGNNVEKIVRTAHNFDEVNVKLTEWIRTNIAIPTALDLPIRQCIMKDYGKDSEQRNKVYKAWFLDTKKKL